MRRDVEPRFFFDENLLPVGRALAAVRRDVVYPGHPAVPHLPLEHRTLTGSPRRLPPGSWPSLGTGASVPDRWSDRLSPTPAPGWSASPEKQNLDMWQRLDTVVRAWPAIENAALQPGPWVKGLAGGALRDLKL